MRLPVCGALLALAALTARADGLWLEKTHDFGAFDEETGVVYADFHLVNTGTEPIAIIAARANCGCTKPAYSRDPIAPGDTAVITVGYDPEGRPGRFTKYVNVDLDTAPARTQLTIKGTVIGASNTLRSRYPIEVGPMKLRTSALPFGEVAKGHSVGQYLEAYNASSDSLRPIVAFHPDYISTIVEPAVVPPGDRFVVSTVLHSERTPLWGTVTDSLRIELPTGEGITVPTAAILMEDFSKLTPKERENAPAIVTDLTAIDLRSVTRSDAPTTHTFMVKNEGKSPLIIRSIATPSEAVEVEMKNRKVKPGKSEKVTVKVLPGRLSPKAEMLNARINIISNDPFRPSIMVRVVAEVKPD